MYMFMWYFFMYFFFMGLFCFFFVRVHIIMCLLSLEFVVLYLLFMIFFYCLMYDFSLYMYILFMTFFVCEGALGLSVLVTMIRSHGNDYLSSFLLW